MKWHYKTFEIKELEMKQPHEWFAWYPVWQDGVVVWLQSVWRRATWVYDGWNYEYDFSKDGNRLHREEALRVAQKILEIMKNSKKKQRRIAK